MNKTWLSIQKNFQRGVLNWIESWNRLKEEGASDDEIKELIGTEEQFKQALQDANISAY